MRAGQRFKGYFREPPLPRRADNGVPMFNGNAPSELHQRPMTCALQPNVPSEVRNRRPLGNNSGWGHHGAVTTMCSNPTQGVLSPIVAGLLLQFGE